MKKFLLALALAFCGCPLFGFVNESTLDVEVGGRSDQVRFDFCRDGIEGILPFRQYSLLSDWSKG